MKQRENNYDRSYKVEALKLLENSGKSITDVAHDLGIAPSLLTKWKARYEVNEETDKLEAVSSKGSGKKMRELKRELAIVKQERDILKKAISIFSKDEK